MFAVPVGTVLPSAAPATHPARVAIEVAADRARWTRLLRYDPDHRWSALIEARGDLEVWLLSWLPGQSTDRHDHAGSAGAFTVVSGVLTETVFRPAGETEHLVGIGRTRVFGRDHVHRVRNMGGDPAVSIHVYSPRRPV